MANSLNYKLKDFEKALLTLEDALQEKETDLMKDGVIQRFEYNYELCWKTSKVFLDEKMGTIIYSPRECFRELRRNKLISDKETEILLEMVNDRNKVAHTYNENFADELFKKIKSKYAKLIRKVFVVIGE